MGTITREFKRYKNNTEATSTGTTLNISFKLIQTSETDDTYLFNSIPYYSNVTKTNIKMYAKANSSALTQIGAYIGKVGTLTNGSANNAYNNREYNTSTQTISTTYKWMTFTGFESYFDTSPDSLGLTKDRLICVRFYATSSKTWYRSNFSIELTYNTPTVNISASGNNGSVSGSKTIDILEHGVNYSTTLTAVPNTGYKFVKWSDGATANPRTFTYNDSQISQNSTTITCNPVFEKTDTKVNAVFHKADGTTQTVEVNSGSAVGTLPTTSRSGYEFGGWLPCAPANKITGGALDSEEYKNSHFNRLAKSYKYTDRISVYVEAYMDDWSKISSPTGTIISCTEGGGWGIGYGANTTGHGCELHASGYKGIDFGITNLSSGWHRFGFTFYNGTFKAYLDDTLKGTQTTSGTLVTYNNDNTIFVGAEPNSSDTTPNGDYFNGIISNVFIANNDAQLKPITSSTVITSNVDYYPIWRKKAAQPPEFTSVHMYYSNKQISETHKVPVGQGFIIEVEVQ